MHHETTHCVCCFLVLSSTVKPVDTGSTKVVGWLPPGILHLARLQLLCYCLSVQMQQFQMFKVRRRQRGGADAATAKIAQQHDAIVSTD